MLELAKFHAPNCSQSYDVSFVQFDKVHLHLLSQAAACDGTTMTTSADGQNIIPGTLPTY